MTWSPTARWGQARPEVKWKKEVERVTNLRSLTCDDTIHRQLWRTKSNNRRTTGQLDRQLDRITQYRADVSISVSAWKCGWRFTWFLQHMIDCTEHDMLPTAEKIYKAILLIVNYCLTGFDGMYLRRSNNVFLRSVVVSIPVYTASDSSRGLPLHSPPC